MAGRFVGGNSARGKAGDEVSEKRELAGDGDRGLVGAPISFSFPTLTGYTEIGRNRSENIGGWTIPSLSPVED